MKKIVTVGIDQPYAGIPDEVLQMALVIVIDTNDFEDEEQMDKDLKAEAQEFLFNSYNYYYYMEDFDPKKLDEIKGKGIEVYNET